MVVVGLDSPGPPDSGPPLRWTPSAKPPKISHFFFPTPPEPRKMGSRSVGPRRVGPGFHTTVRELQTCTFQVPGASNTTKIPREDLQEREERKKNVAEEGKKKARKFWAPTLRGPTIRRPTFAQTGNSQKVVWAKSGLGQKWYLPANHSQRFTASNGARDTRGSCARPATCSFV